MAKFLYTVKLPPSKASVEDARKLLKLKRGQLDQDFGVVLIDPSNDLYTILVDEGAVERLDRNGAASAEGPFANPKIEPFGPPR